MQNKTKIKIIVGLIGIAIIAIIVNYVLKEVISVQGNWIRHVYIRNTLVKAEVVKTETRIEKGLEGRTDLPAGRGMLFQMPDEDIQNFWMQGMQFAIDIIWIDSGRVTGCEKNVSPNDKRIFTSPGEARYILEVPAGFCDTNKVKINDAVKM